MPVFTCLCLSACACLCAPAMPIQGSKRRKKNEMLLKTYWLMKLRIKGGDMCSSYRLEVHSKLKLLSVTHVLNHAELQRDWIVNGEVMDGK